MALPVRASPKEGNEQYTSGQPGCRLCRIVTKASTSACASMTVPAGVAGAVTPAMGMLPQMTGRPSRAKTSAASVPLGSSRSGVTTAFTMETIVKRRAEPTDDLFSILVNAEVDGEQLSDDEILYETLLILIGGDETTRHTLSGGTEQLLRHHDQW